MMMMMMMMMMIMMMVVVMVVVVVISSNDDCVFDKYADDTIQIGLITDDDSVYVEQKDAFINWCKNNYLVLNVEKTKEMIIDSRKITSDPAYLKIDNKEVERVRSFK
ncbi:reverse transcriptase-like protein [Elysia marginata]|uniref:Reverse transcriptase-like protein n=1 Tax=Elysia marginata TaxID=1093978 RepID=A0AAV4J6V8_9GAST|nr:reverse transcriptase-like protein [Elysia marginata]